MSRVVHATPVPQRGLWVLPEQAGVLRFDDGYEIELPKQDMELGVGDDKVIPNVTRKGGKP